MPDEIDRTTLARAVLAAIRLRALTDMLRNRRVWREQVFRGFRPDSITRSIANGAASRFAANPAALIELVSVYVSDLGYDDEFSEGLIAAANDPRVPQETQTALRLAAGAGDLGQLPSGSATATTAQMPSPRPLADKEAIVAEPFDIESQHIEDREPLTPSAHERTDPAGRARAGGVKPEPPPIFSWTQPQDEVGEIQAATTLFERCLSAFTRWRLESLHGDAWLRKGCGPWKNDWRKREGEKKEGPRTTKPETLFGYASLSQLKEIIVRSENWKAFEPYFISKSWLEMEFNNLLPARDGGAHAAERRIYKSEQVSSFRSMCTITDRFHQDTAAKIDRIWSQQSQQYEEEVLPTLERVAKNFDSLTKIELIGRKDEMARLYEFWNSEFERAICITGRGGVGKTALAYSFVNELLNRPCKAGEKPQPELVLSLTAKNNWIEGQVESPAEQRFNSLRRILDAFIELCGGDTSPERDLEELRDEALALARDMPCLIMLDNLETIPDEELEQIGTLVRRLPAPSKVILTDRERRAFGERLNLGGLDSAAAIELVRALIAKDEVKIPGTQDRAIRIVSEKLNGVPLYLQFFANLLVDGYTASEALQKLRGRGMLWLLEFSFASSVDNLSNDARELLYYLARVPDPVTRSDLHKVVADSERLDDAVRRLRSVHFIETVEMGSFRITDQQLREYVIADFPARSRITAGAASRISYLANAPVQSHPNIERAVQQLIHEANELGRSDWEQAYDRLKQGRNEFGDRPEIMAEIGYFAYRLRRLEEAQRLLEGSFAKGYQDADKHRTLGLVHLYRRRFEDAIRQAKSSLTLRPDEPRSQLLLGDALLNKASRSTFALDARRRRELVEEAMEVIRDSLIEDDLARWQRDHNERRTRLLEKAEALQKTLVDA